MGPSTSGTRETDCKVKVRGGAVVLRRLCPTSGASVERRVKRVSRTSRSPRRTSREQAGRITEEMKQG